ncbi:hypothetical protein GGR34_003340 [Microvirga flocculans]|uniref:Uncharacterized protein n=1 Tax=Microvirga flocculans TaxID=217168 RepID=A0A7W6IHN1_9HYPH|nr:hypothetical protein [Microvirga flocculans]MBB4041662.1 hypothetical protein [Microvirga flocculans]
MAIKLTEADHNKLDALLDGVLDAHASGDVILSQAREAIAHVFAAAAIDNETEVKSWLEPDRLESWKEECRKTRD